MWQAFTFCSRRSASEQALLQRRMLQEFCRKFCKKQDSVRFGYQEQKCDLQGSSYASAKLSVEPAKLSAKWTALSAHCVGEPRWSSSTTGDQYSCSGGRQLSRCSGRCADCWPAAPSHDPRLRLCKSRCDSGLHTLLGCLTCSLRVQSSACIELSLLD